MTPAERALWQRMQRRAAAAAPELRAALLRGFARLRENLSDAQLERLIREGRLERLLSEGFSPEQFDRAFADLTTELQASVVRAGVLTARELPAAARGVSFNVLAPNVVEGVRKLETEVTRTLEEGVRETARAYVEQGLREGAGPAAIARGLRSTIGLAPNQLLAVENYRKALEGVPGARSPSEYKLRDRRYDASVRAGDLSETQIERMADAYRRRMTAFHAETVTRTMALDAQRLGEHLTWQAAVERGDIDGSRLTKRWAGVLDNRERPEHVAMEGETVAWDARYSNGEMVPGESTWNCRCKSFYKSVADPLKALRRGAGEAGVSREQLLAAEQRR